jgi:hypothetical protein
MYVSMYICIYIYIHTQGLDVDKIHISCDVRVCIYLQISSTVLPKAAIHTHTHTYTHKAQIYTRYTYHAICVYVYLQNSSTVLSKAAIHTHTHIYIYTQGPDLYKMHTQMRCVCMHILTK